MAKRAMFKINNDNKVSWVLVNSLGKLKFSRSSYYYLIIVPILVKAMEKVNNPLFLKVGDSNIQISLELPFSWYLFYFGAVAIALGSLLYQIFCPELIKNYRNYGEFLDSGESDNYLNRISEKHKISIFTLPTLGEPYLEEKEVETVKMKPLRWSDDPKYQEKEKVIGYKQNIKYQEDRKNAFNTIYNFVKFSNNKIIYISFSLYMLGFLAFAWVIIQNIYFVIKHLF